MRAKLYAALSKFHVLFKLIYSNRLRVLAYHEVQDEKVFENQIKYLRSQYNIIGIPDLIDFFEKNTPLPKNSLIITFDDGDVSVLKKGMPVLRKFDIKSCLFIITGLVNTSDDVWIKRVEAQVMNTGKSYRESREVVKYFKKIPNAERIEKMKDYPAVKKPQLSTTDLKKLEKQGMFIANHTHTHPMLDTCSRDEIRQELIDSKKVFSKLSFSGFNVFAYPNGNADAKTTAIMKEFAMKLVFLFDHKINKSKLDPLHISRIKVDSHTEINEFKAKVSGAHPFLLQIEKKIKK